MKARHHGMKIVKSRSKPSCRQISGLNSEEKKERQRQKMVEYRKVSPPPTSVDDCLGLPVTAPTGSSIVLWIWGQRRSQEMREKDRHRMVEYRKARKVSGGWPSCCQHVSSSSLLLVFINIIITRVVDIVVIITLFPLSFSSCDGPCLFARSPEGICTSQGIAAGSLHTNPGCCRRRAISQHIPANDGHN